MKAPKRRHPERRNTGPLRLITGYIPGYQSTSLFDTDRVTLECGHTGNATPGAMRARCRKCQREERVMEATVIRANGTMQRWPLAKKLTLSQYQMLVGGYVEVVQVRHEGQVRDMVLNEDGLNLGLALNERATNLLELYWLEKIGPPEQRVPCGTVARVVGDVLILHGCRL